MRWKWIILLFSFLSIRGFCTLPLDPVIANGVVIPWEGGLVFRFQPDGRNIFALEDPHDLVGEPGSRVQVEGQLTPRRFNGLPMILLQKRGASFGSTDRAGPFMQPATKKTSRTFFQEELEYAARLRVGLETADADRDGVTDAFDSDDDNDGMPDSYEIQEGLDPRLDDRLLDEDGDSMSNYDEFRAGTLAGDNTSFLGIFSITLSPSNVCLHWNSVSGKVYSVMAADKAGQEPYPALLGISAQTTQSWTQACVPDTGTVYFIRLEEP